MKKFSARLISLMETLEVSGYQLAREIGSSDMSISKYKADKALPCFEFFENLVTRYPSVNLNWLIGNHGEIFLTPEAHTKTPIPDAHTAQLSIPIHLDPRFRFMLTPHSDDVDPLSEV